VAGDGSGVLPWANSIASLAADALTWVNGGRRSQGEQPEAAASGRIAILRALCARPHPGLPPRAGEGAQRQRRERLCLFLPPRSGRSSGTISGGVAGRSRTASDLQPPPAPVHPPHDAPPQRDEDEREHERRDVGAKERRHPAGEAALV